MNSSYSGAVSAGRPFRQRPVRDCALTLLERCDRTASEMRRKLRERGYSEDDIENTMIFLEEYRYIDDREYVRRYIRAYSARKSISRLRGELAQKGILRELIDEAFEENPVDEDSQISYWLRKKGYVSGQELPPDQYRRLTAFLARRGYPYEAVRRVMAQLEE